MLNSSTAPFANVDPATEIVNVVVVALTQISRVFMSPAVRLVAAEKVGYGATENAFAKVTVKSGWPDVAPSRKSG